MASSVSNDFADYLGHTPGVEDFIQPNDRDDILLDSLESFVSSGMQNGDGIVVIASADQLAALHQRLVSRGFNLDAARQRDQYLALDVEESLREFSIDGWPEAVLFENFVTDVVARAGRNGRRVRAFSDMLSRLRCRVSREAAEQIDRLWHSICQQQDLALMAPA